MEKEASTCASFSTLMPGLSKEAGNGSLRDALARNVSHELRTPLAIVQGYIELLKEGTLGNLTSDQARAVVAVANQTHRLRRLVERVEVLLAVGAGTGFSMPLLLGGLVAEVVEEYRRQARRSGLEIELATNTETSFVHGDPYHLRHAVGALVENAIKFTPQGGRIRIEVSVEEPWVYLEVSDTGIGIQEEELDRLFTGFYQVDRSVTRRYGGIGLGLTLVKSVIAEHGGQVSVESQVGVGSQFTLRLPGLLFGIQPEGLIGKGMIIRQILLVDDDRSVALVLKEGLEVLPGCVVTVASNGKEALKMLRRQSFDLLVTDYRMPGMDGLTLASHVRREYPSMVIIMITVHTGGGIREQASRLAIRRVLDKPVSLNDIRREILQALE